MGSEFLVAGPFAVETLENGFQFVFGYSRPFVLDADPNLAIFGPVSAQDDRALRRAEGQRIGAQIANNLKEELHGKLAEFASSNDNLEEVFENREQIEISKHYERMPKPSLIAVDEFLHDKVYYRNPSKEQN